MPLFTSLPEEEIGQVMRSLRPLALPRHTYLFREGEQGDRFYIVLEGEIEILKRLETGDERLLSVRGTGDFIGEMSLFDREGLRTASVRSRTEVKLLEMTHADFDALLHRQPVLGYELVRELTLRLRDTDNAVIHDLQEKNRQLAEAYEELKAAQAQIIEKEKLEHELQVARKIQESILPHTLPGLAGFDFGARMVPARAVGGDFFDVIPFDEDKVALVIGDVSDKGVPASIFMALTRSLCRAESHPSATPRDVLESVNTHLLDMNEAGMFVTVIYGILDRASGLFQYARAGHEVPMLFDAAGRVTVADHGPGQPLGILPAPALDVREMVISRGATLFLYTDGATDATDPQGVMLGRERLEGTVLASLPGTAQGACDRVIAALAAYQGESPQQDDVTLIMARSNPTPAT
jgi:phosphoserine phosphatase RsbU/P